MILSPRELKALTTYNNQLIATLTELAEKPFSFETSHAYLRAISHFKMQWYELMKPRFCRVSASAEHASAYKNIFSFLYSSALSKSAANLRNDMANFFEHSPHTREARNLLDAHFAKTGIKGYHVEINYQAIANGLQSPFFVVLGYETQHAIEFANNQKLVVDPSLADSLQTGAKDDFNHFCENHHTHTAVRLGRT